MSTTETINRVLAPQPGVGSVKFLSRGRNQRLVREARNIVPNQLGQQVIVADGKAYNFGPNGTLLLEPGQDVMATGPHGEEEDALTWIRRHPQLNTRFWEEGRAPGKPLPSDEQMLERIMRAGMDLQPHRLARLIELEEQSYGRAMLINVARATLGQVLRALGVEPGGDLPDETEEEREAREHTEALEKTQLDLEFAQQRAGGFSEEELAAKQAAATAAAMAAPGLKAQDDLVR